MAITSHRVGRGGLITAHMWSQVGTVTWNDHEPTAAQLAQRNDVAAIYAAFVAKAGQSLSLAVYDVRLSGEAAHVFLGALNERARAGVAVRIAYQPLPGGGTPGAFSLLHPAVGLAQMGPPGNHAGEALGAPVQGEPIGSGRPLMHSKYIIRDAGTLEAAVLTGSANLTNDAWSLQDNNVLILERAGELARCYANDFAELWDSARVATTGRDDTGVAEVDGVAVGVAFSPGRGRQIDADIAAVIAAARERVLVASMVISSGTVLGAMIDRCHEVEFGGIFDGAQMRHIMREWGGRAGPVSFNSARSAAGKSALFAAVAPLLHEKESLPYHPDTPHNFMHNKLAVCDDLVVTGSFNFSANATRNAENVLFVRSRELAEFYAAYVRDLTSRYPATGLSDAP